MRTRLFLSAVFGLALAATPQLATSQIGAALPGTWRVSGGWLNSAATTTIRLDSPRLGVGTVVDLEKDLGFATNAGAVFAGVDWHFASKHQLRLSYNNIDRTSIKNIDRQLVWGDETYPVNAKIGARFGTRFITLGYQYAIYRREGFEFGPSIAIPVITATVGAGVELASGTVQKQKKDVTVPPPLPGMYFSARVNPKFYVQGNAEYMKATLFGVTVDMTNYRLSGVWLPTAHVGGGVAWSGNKFNLSGKKEDIFAGKISYEVNGPSLFVTLRP